MNLLLNVLEESSLAVNAAEESVLQLWQNTTYLKKLYTHTQIIVVYPRRRWLLN